MAYISMKDIARAAGVSKNSVSLALSGQRGVSAATRQRIHAIAKKLGYRPSANISYAMAQLKACRTVSWRAKLALVNGNADPAALTAHPTVPTYVAGCEARAQRLGYSFDRFWLHDDTMQLSHWRRVLRTRGIKGLVIVGLMDSNQLPARLEAVWREFPAVVTGVRTRRPALSFCCVDHHNLVLTAFERARALGYRRPALVLDEVIDALIERRFSAGFSTAQRDLPRDDRVPIFSDVAGARARPERFHAWLKRHQPDVLFTLYNVVFDWLEAAGLRVPRDLGVIQLEWRASKPHIAGMNQHNHATGEAAVDMLVSQIHNNETGIQEFPRATLIGATWVDGATVRARTPREARR